MDTFNTWAHKSLAAFLTSKCEKSITLYEKQNPPVKVEIPLANRQQLIAYIEENICRECLYGVYSLIKKIDCNKAHSCCEVK